jgi:hypothetical protein
MRRYRPLFLALPLLAWATTAHATVSVYNATLNGANESPVNASPATGSGTFTYDSVLHTLALDVNFSGLLGTTTAAHIHAPTANPFLLTAGVATTQPYFAGFPIGVNTGSYLNTLDLTQASSWNPTFVTNNGGTTATAESAFISFINAGKAYLNLHTTAAGGGVPGGEIRGFLTPEPTACVLTALGIAVLGCVLRRRRG